MVESGCENTDENINKKIEDCPANANGFATLCKFTVLSQPWLSEGESLKVTEIGCTKH